MFSLDTNVAIDALRRPSPALRSRLINARDESLLAVSSIVLFELTFGVAKGTSPNGAERLRRFMAGISTIIEFDAEDAEAAGRLRHHLEAQGTKIGHYDTLVAAQAARRDLVLVTANIGEFSRVPRLKLEDWRA